MKKVSVIMVSITIAIIFSSCSFKAPIDNEVGDEEQVLKVKGLFEALEEKDKDAIKDLFSERALDEVNTMDEDIEYLFEVVEGEFESVEKDIIGSEHHINSGVILEELLMAHFTIKTDMGYYDVRWRDYTVYDKEPEKIGLYSLVIEKVNADGEFDRNWLAHTVPGIYRPFNNTDDKRKAIEQITKITGLIETGDKDTLKSLFSESSIVQVESLEDNLERLLDYYDGTLDSVVIRGPIIGKEDSTDEGMDYRYTYFGIDTTEDRYIVFLLEEIPLLSNTDEGTIYTLSIENVFDHEDFMGWQSRKALGIYVPED